MDLSLGPLALGDVMKDYDGAGQLSAFSDGAAHVLDGECRSVLLPKHLDITSVHRPVAVSGIDRTFVLRIRSPVGSGVVPTRVAVLPDQFLHGTAQHPGGGSIGKTDHPLEIQPDYALARRVQDELSLAVQMSDQFLRPFAFAD